MASQSNCIIEIDGGVNEHTAPKLLDAGADVLVAGNYVFASSNPIETIASLKKLGNHTTTGA
jgi:ribulose-phosphate 3-epimerase